LTPGKSLSQQLRDRSSAVREEAQRRVAAEVARRGGDTRAAAEALGISPRTAQRWMDAYADTAAVADVATDAAAGTAAMTSPTLATAPPAPVATGSSQERPVAGELEALELDRAADQADPAAATALSSPRHSAERRAPTQPEAVPPKPGLELDEPASARRPARPSGDRTPFVDFGPLHGRTLDEQVRSPAPTPPAAAARSAPRAAQIVGWGATPSPGELLERQTPQLRKDPATGHPEPEPSGSEGQAPIGWSHVPRPQAGTPPVPTSPHRPVAIDGRAAGEWPHHQPGVTAPLPESDGDGGPRRLALVLHAHLPWVLGHGTWPHGEDWLAEAAAHCYLPLLDALERLAARGGRNLMTLSFSPVLAAQLADPRTPPLVSGYLTHRRDAAREVSPLHPLGGWWEAFYDRLLAAWERLGGDLLGAARRLREAGVVELSTCAATHGYLPLLHRREHVSLQVAAAVANHERWAGARPDGLWMPECAYRPGGPWRHPATGAVEEDRPGNESFLAAEGILWTVVDAHLVLGGKPVLPYDLVWGAAGVERPPDAPPPLARRLQPLLIEDSSVTALSREPHTAHQVWSRHGGYPGDPRYLDFHKRHAESGLRLWQVTDPAGDLAHKLPYHPAGAAAALHDQAAHFVDLVARVPGLGGGVAVCPYDAELFGHWWFEGVDWLEAVLGRCLDDPRVETTTPSRELFDHPPRARVALDEGSWGEEGDHRVWVNDSTAWMWEALREAEDAVAAALPSAGPARGRAMLAQLLLLAASDWPFLVTAGTAADYAAERFRTHRDRLELLLAGGDDDLPAWVGEDLAGLTLDPAWWRTDEG
jgi:1,4-alpha-glucan branching enzyme